MFIIREWLEDYIDLKLSNSELIQVLEELDFTIIKTYNLADLSANFMYENGFYINSKGETLKDVFPMTMKKDLFTVGCRDNSHKIAKDEFGLSYFLIETEEKDFSYRSLALAVAEYTKSNYMDFQPQVYSKQKKQLQSIFENDSNREYIYLYVQSEASDLPFSLQKRIYLSNIDYVEFHDLLLKYIELDYGISPKLIHKLDLSKNEGIFVYRCKIADFVDSLRFLNLWEQFARITYVYIYSGEPYDLPRNDDVFSRQKKS